MNLTDREFSDLLTKFSNEVDEKNAYWTIYRIIAQKKNILT
jgi:hypothetical protein